MTLVVKFSDLNPGDFVQYKNSVYQIISIVKDLKKLPGLPRNSCIAQLDRPNSNGINWIVGDGSEAIEILSANEKNKLFEQLKQASI